MPERMSIYVSTAPYNYKPISINNQALLGTNRLPEIIIEGRVILVNNTLTLENINTNNSGFLLLFDKRDRNRLTLTATRDIQVISYVN